jgi:hypothetical protein
MCEQLYFYILVHICKLRTFLCSPFIFSYRASLYSLRTVVVNSSVCPVYTSLCIDYLHISTVKTVLLVISCLVFA